MAGKYDHIDFKPPKSVAETAARGLSLRQRAKKSNKGGLTPSQAKKEGVGSGVQRAVNLKNRNTLSPSTVRRMLRFFTRHEKNAKIDPGKTALTDKGKQSWDLWGGNAGYAWARKVVRQMDAAEAKAKSKKKSRAAMMPIFEQIIRVAGVSAENLEGIYPVELAELAGHFDAAGLFSEADELDAMLLKSANDDEYPTGEGDPVDDTQDGDPIDDSPGGRDHSEEAYRDQQIEDTVKESTPEELGEELKQRFENEVGLQVKLVASDDMAVVWIGSGMPFKVEFKVTIDANKTFTVTDSTGGQHRLPDDAAHSLFRDDWANNYEDFIMGPTKPQMN